MMKSVYVFLIAFFLGGKAVAQCNSMQIFVEENSVCAPKMVRFNIVNPPDSALFYWDIGKGSTSGAETIYGYYDAPGVINASIEVKLSNGDVCRITKDSALVVNALPQPIFSVSRTKLCNGPDTIKLVDLTPNIVVRNWVVDGTSYNNANQAIVHSFVTTGLKNISLIAADINGCQGVNASKDVVEVFPNLKFDFAANKLSGCVPLETKYTISSNPKTPYSKSFMWLFEGAVTQFSNVDTPGIIRYDEPGNKTASLSVFTSNGCNYIVSKPNYIRVGDAINLDLGLEDTVFCVGDSIRLSQIPTLKGGTTNWYLSGTSDTLQNISNYSSLVIPKETGNLTVRLVHNFNNCVSQKVYKDTIKVRGVKADFQSNDRYHCEVPHTVHLQNTTDKMDAQSVSYTWVIRENGEIKNTSNNENDSFTFYKLPASYDVQLIAVGDNGCLDSVTRLNYVYQDSLKLDFEALPKIGCVNQEIRFNNKTKPSSYLSGDQFEWYFKDLDHLTNRDSSFIRSPSTSYSDTGFYDVLLIGKNGINCRDTLRLDSIVRIIEPKLKFEVDTNTICLGDTFFLKGLTTPVEANFKHNWQLIHLETNKQYNYSGNELSIIPITAGEYILVYSYNIMGGCIEFDTISLYVNGIAGSIVLDKTGGCAPLDVNPMLQLNYNYNFGASGNTILHSWDVNRKSGVSLVDVQKSSPNFKFNIDGEYRVQVKLTNGAGCFNNTTSEIITIGVQSNFNLAKSVICFGDSLRVKDLRSNNSEILSWDIKEDLESKESQINEKDFSFYVSKEGDYTIRQIVHRDMLCFDTLIRQFKVIKVKASFTNTDTFLMCAPVYVQFQSSSVNADSLLWDFGDGSKEVTKSSSAGHVYEKNSGWRKGFDITLVAKSKYGCVDTAIKADYMVVQGPVPFFIPSHTSGCEPLNVNFKNQSQDAVQSILNYNDGTSLDYTKEPNYTFEHIFRNNPDSSISEFIIDLVAYDSLGCAAKYSLPSPIRVSKSPQIKLQQLASNNSCVPFNLTIADTSHTAISWEWKIDTISKISDSTIKLPLSNFGDYPAEVIALNDIGCGDTLQFVVIAKESPKVDFLLDDSLCKNKLSHFFGEVSSFNPVNKISWDLGETSNKQNTNYKDFTASIAYQFRGDKKIKFKATLENGCSSSVIKNAYITDDADIDTSHIKYVSFNDNLVLDIYYFPHTYTKFDHYLLNKSGNSWKKEFDKNTLNVKDLFETQPLDSFCYDLSVQDYCNFTGIRSTKHCFINLTINSEVEYTSTLKWTPYVGWPSVKDYTIYKSKNSEDFEILTKVSGTILEYIDTNLCDEEYTYYIQASHPYEDFKSNSARATIRPKYLYNPTESSIKNVSVVGENQIEVSWSKSSFSQTESYIISKFSCDGINMLDEFEIRDTSIIDKNVLTQKESYIYFVTEKDRCGYLNKSKRPGKSILLKGLYLNQTSTESGSKLWWTRYKDWENGVQDYNVLLFDHPEVRVLETTKSDTTYVDPEYHKNINEEYCYQIFATNDDRDTSFSNVICLNGKSFVDVPTAFSPNKDGLNDEFKPITQFIKLSDFSGIHHYTFTVYNRWGEKLFETNDVNAGWNGIYKNSKCQPGVYMYNLSVKSLDNYVSNYAGYVTLIQ